MEGRQVFKESFWAVLCQEVGTSKLCPLCAPLPLPQGHRAGIQQSQGVMGRSLGGTVNLCSLLS